MKDFDQRWQTLAHNARQASKDVPADLPLGFATRVMARARAVPLEAWEEAFNLLGWRAVMATAVVLLLSTGLAFSELYDARIEPPTLEKIVTSDLSWP